MLSETHESFLSICFKQNNKGPRFLQRISTWILRNVYQYLLRDYPSWLRERRAAEMTDMPVSQVGKINIRQRKCFLSRHFRVQGLVDFSAKGQMVNILDFEGHVVSVTTTQLCCCRSRVVADNPPINEHGWLQYNTVYINRQPASQSHPSWWPNKS